MTMRFDIKAEGFDELGDRLGQAGTKARKSINQGLREIGRYTVPILKRHTPHGVTGHLASKTRFELITAGRDQELQIRQGAMSGSGFFYGRVVREGRRAGARMPPPDALLLWVSRVLGIPPERARSVAFVVARSIGRKGIKANPYHVRAFQEALPRIKQVVQQMGQRIVAYLAGG